MTIGVSTTVIGPVGVGAATGTGPPPRPPGMSRAGSTWKRFEGGFDCSGQVPATLPVASGLPWQRTLTTETRWPPALQVLSGVGPTQSPLKHPYTTGLPSQRVQEPTSSVRSR